MAKSSVYFITGKNSVGKTTFIERAVEWDSRHIAIYPGKECREKFGEKAFTEADQPEAPNFSEAFVRNLINNAVSELLDESNCYDTLYVDGFPRRIDQLDVTQEVAKVVDSVMLYYCVCQEPERLRRQKLRSDEAQKLAVARDKTEPETMFNIIEACALRDVKLVYLDLTQQVLHVDAPYPLKGHLLMQGQWLQRLVKACERIELWFCPITFILTYHMSDKGFEEKWIKSEFNREAYAIGRFGGIDDRKLQQRLIAPLISLVPKFKKLDTAVSNLWTSGNFDRLFTLKQGSIITRLTAAEWLYIDHHCPSEVSSVMVGLLKKKLPEGLVKAKQTCCNIKVVRYKGKVRA